MSTPDINLLIYILEIVGQLFAATGVAGRFRTRTLRERGFLASLFGGVPLGVGGATCR